LSFGGGGSKAKQEEEKKPIVEKKIEEKMSDEEEAPKRLTKKRPQVIDDEDEGGVTTLEENVPTPLKPAPVSTPGKPAVTIVTTATSKKIKTNDGKEVEPIKAIIKENPAPSKGKTTVVEEVKENVQLNFGPPKDLTKLRAPSSASYDPIEDAPFYKGQPVPFGFLTRALSEIELCKG